MRNFVRVSSNARGHGWGVLKSDAMPLRWSGMRSVFELRPIEMMSRARLDEGGGHWVRSYFRYGDLPNAVWLSKAPLGEKYPIGSSS